MQFCFNNVARSFSILHIHTIFFFIGFVTWAFFFWKYASHAYTHTHTHTGPHDLRDRARLAHVRDWQKFISCDLHVARKLRVWCAFAAWGPLFRWQGLSSVLSALSWIVVEIDRIQVAWGGDSKTTARILGTDVRRPSRLFTVLITFTRCLNPNSENPRCPNNRL